MADPDSAPSAGRFEVRVTADSHFGWIRTRFSLERTMMSWIRTAVSLIGFGFAIVQFFERLQEMPGVRPTEHPRASQYLGLALIACGSSVACDLDLAVPVGDSLPVGRIVRANRRNDKGRNTITGFSRLPSFSFASGCSLSLPCCCTSCSRLRPGLDHT